MNWKNEVMTTVAPLTVDSLRKLMEAVKEYPGNWAPQQVPVSMSMGLYEKLEGFYAKPRLLAVLKKILEKKMPYYLRRHYEPSKWVTHRCRYQREKGEREFIKWHC